MSDRFFGREHTHVTSETYRNRRTRNACAESAHVDGHVCRVADVPAHVVPATTIVRTTIVSMNQ